MRIMQIAYSSSKVSLSHGKIPFHVWQLACSSHPLLCYHIRRRNRFGRYGVILDLSPVSSFARGCNESRHMHC
jgi:hypothetical protein